MKDPALNPVHPGEILLEDFLKPLEISQYRLAKDIHVPLRRVNEIALGRRLPATGEASRDASQGRQDAGPRPGTDHRHDLGDTAQRLQRARSFVLVQLAGQRDDGTAGGGLTEHAGDLERSPSERGAA
jgi:hypothetical protein